MNPGKTACPPREKFENFFRSESRPEEGERLVDHVLNCPACRIRFDVLREVSAEIRGRLPEFEALAAASLDEARAFRQGTGLGGGNTHPFFISAGEYSGSGSPGKAQGPYRCEPPGIAALIRFANEDCKAWGPGRRRKTARNAGRRFAWSTPRAIVTAILLVVAGTAAFFVVQHRIAENTVRGRGDAALEIVYPRGVVTATPDVLRWSRAAGAEYYYIELIDDRLNIILPRVFTGADFYNLAPEVTGRLEKGRTYIWSIEAFDDLNRKITSDEADFQIEVPR